MEKVITAHELANALLQLNDKPICVVEAKEHGYTRDTYLSGNPWEDPFGSIRIMAHPGGVYEKVLVSKEAQ